MAIDVLPPDPLLVWQTVSAPAIFASGGDHAAKRYAEFFTAHIRNPNTRQAYAIAVNQFADWCERHRLRLEQLQPVVIATYIEALGRERSAPTVKQHLAALRMLFDYLVIGQVCPTNPCHAVRGPKHVVKQGKTPVLSAEQARTLLDSIDIGTMDLSTGQFSPNLMGLRDRALIATMVYSFARIGAVVGMNVEDYWQNGKRWWLRLREKGGKHHDVPAHHNTEAYLDAYLHYAGLAVQLKSPLFVAIPGKTGLPTARRFDRRDALAMIKRRAKAIGLPRGTCCHTFRATGITAYLSSPGATLERAMAIACHESARTTKLYDRRSDEISLDEIERIMI